MDYRNADGSIAEMCGNGVRVFARYLLDHGLASGPAFGVATRAGCRQVQAEPDGRITVDMGPVTVAGPGRAVLGGAVLEGLRISVGNPHLAILVDGRLDKFDLSVPPGLDPVDFPDGGNVELVRVTGSSAISMRVHERGSGETRSCGTGAVAAAAAAAARYPGRPRNRMLAGHRAGWRADRAAGQRDQLAHRPSRDRRPKATWTPGGWGMGPGSRAAPRR